MDNSDDQSLSENAKLETPARDLEAAPDGSQAPAEVINSTSEESASNTPIEPSALIPPGQEIPPGILTRNEAIWPLKAGIAVLVLVLVAVGVYYYFKGVEDRLISDGNAHLAASEWSEAAVVFGQVILLEPSFVREHMSQAVAGRGEAYYRAGNYEQALADWDQTAASDPTNPLPYLRQAEIYYLQGDLKQALTEADAILELDDSLAYPYNLRALKDYQDRKYPEAMAAAEAAIQRQSDQAGLAYRVKGSLEAWGFDLEAAQKDLDRAIELLPNDLEASAMRVFVALQQEDKVTAEAEVRRMSQTDPQAAVTLWAEGMLAAYNDERVEAHDLADQAIALDGNRPEFYLLRAGSIGKAAQEEEALADSDKALSLYPDFLPAMSAKANLLIYRFEFDEAEPYIQTILQRAPAWVGGRGLQIGLLWGRCEYDQALKEANQLVEENPQKAIGYLLRGTHYLITFDFTKAEADFNQALDIDQDSSEALTYLASIDIVRHKYDDALQKIDQAARSDPDTITIHLSRAVYYTGKGGTGSLAKASEEISQALALDPDRREALIAQMGVELAQQNHLQALESINKVIARYPKFPDAYIDRGLIYAADQKFDQAEEEIKIAMAMNFKNPIPYAAMAEVKNQAGDYKTAIDNAELAIKQAPWLSGGYAQRGLAYLSQNNTDRAVSDLKKSLELYSNQPTVHSYLGEAYRRLGIDQEAIQELQTALDQTEDVSLTNQVEPVLAFMKQLPAVVNGQRTFEDEQIGYSVTIPSTWTPEPVSDQTVVLMVRNYNEEAYGAFYVDTPEMGVAGLTPTIWADYFQKALSQEHKLDLIPESSKVFQANMMTGIARVYPMEDDYMYMKAYYFVSGKRIATVIFFTEYDTFTGLEAEVDAFMHSFKLNP